MGLQNFQQFFILFIIVNNYSDCQNLSQTQSESIAEMAAINKMFPNPVEFDFAQEAEVMNRVSYALDTEKLVELANFEKGLNTKLKKQYVKLVDKGEEKNKLESLRLYLEDYEQSSLIATKMLGKTTKLKATFAIATNPILMYKMIRRCSKDWAKIVTDVHKHPELSTGILNDMKALDLLIPVPTDLDLTDAFEGLLRIHSVYELPLNQFTQGIIGDSKTQASLNGKDCLAIGKYALGTKNYALAIEWLAIAREITLPETDPVLKGLIAKYLTTAVRYHDKVWNEWKHAEMEIRDLKLRKGRKQRYMDSRDNLFDAKLSDNLKLKDVVKVSTLLRQNAAGVRTKESSDLESQEICNGNNFQTTEEKSRLKCWLDTNTHPHWKINPLKTELLHSDPDLIQLHDFIGDDMINSLKKISVPDLKRSGVINYSKFGTEFSNYRSSLNSWIYDLPLLEPFYERIEFATGLHVKRFGASQALQVVDYSALGSHYDAHNDGMQDPKLIKDWGDRILTFMIYLNDVEMGGYTAFPILGTAAKPAKGSAIFWYNFFRNGTEDRRARHCGCPVVLGRKLIVNKWILSNENMFRKPCLLNIFK